MRREHLHSDTQQTLRQGRYASKLRLLSPRCGAQKYGPEALARVAGETLLLRWMLGRMGWEVECSKPMSFRTSLIA
jgi:hypothetical protein